MHEAFQPGTRWRVTKACTLEARVWADGKLKPWTRKLKAGETITCLGIKRHWEGVPAVQWEADAEGATLRESAGLHGSCCPVDGYLRKENA